MLPHLLLGGQVRQQVFGHVGAAQRRDALAGDFHGLERRGGVLGHVTRGGAVRCGAEGGELL